HSADALVEPITSLAGEAQATIEKADTFFVASYLPTKTRREVEGVDVSHRGGRAGFVKVEGNTLTVPDYSGNYHFNTLGNFLLNPKAGLLFPNFESGDVLMLTGTVELLWENDPEIAAFRGAERGWRVTMERGLWLRDALPFRAELGEFSPNSMMAGDWAETEATLALEAQRNAWRPFKVTRIEQESSVIRSFYLEPADGKLCLSFEAGQFLTLRVTPDSAAAPAIRTYTVSSAPTDPQYRISVKREPDGLVSRFLHDTISVGDTLEIKAPSGDFTLDPSVARPAVLLAGGVGITPMMSMARHVVKEGLRTRHFRKVTVFHAAQTTGQRAFRDAFRHMEVQSNGAISYISMVNRPADDEKPGVHFNGVGYITADILRQVLPLDDYDFYLCGPPSFMQALYDVLRGLGVRDARIFAEAFGPASLVRQPDEGAPQPAAVEEAESAVVKFTQSGFEQRWNAGDATLLETAESHGLSPNYGCRNGVCGSCATKVKSGSVAYRSSPSADHADDEALICCAVPAKGTDVLELEL
ncbi:MAG: 2Fe-2S iron-sulfur cluster-binding protein, partial [Pseudomonadota bacterium]